MSPFQLIDDDDDNSMDEYLKKIAKQAANATCELFGALAQRLRSTRDLFHEQEGRRNVCFTRDS